MSLHAPLWFPMSVCACGFSTSIHTCHMPHATYSWGFIQPCNTSNNSSLFSLSSFKSDNKSIHLYNSYYIHTFDMNCRYPLPYPSYQQDSYRLAVVLTLSHTRTLVHTMMTMCMHMCIYVFKYVDSVDLV